jgi:biopolymer transport protein TolQ
MIHDFTFLLIIAQTVEKEAAQSASWWEIVINAGPMVKFVLILLAWFSVMCWGIILLKQLQFRAVRNDNARFLEKFWGGASLDSIYRDTKSFRRSPLAKVFQSGYQELGKIKKVQHVEGAKPEEIAIHLSGVESVGRALRRAAGSERSRMERYLSFLATTGSTAPFVGLFGTVWGIMTSFRHIAVLGDVGLEVVAPGISEALIATAAGFAAAIPAVVAYNYFLANARTIASEMEHFSADVLNIIQRHFF